MNATLLNQFLHGIVVLGWVISKIIACTVYNIGLGLRFW